MAKKKTYRTRFNNFFYKTRLGFYTLVVLAIVLMVASVKTISNYPTDSNVLGESTGRSQEKRAEQSARHEERKAEIRNDFSVDPNNLQVKFEDKNGNLDRRLETKKNEAVNHASKEEIESIVQSEFEDENDTEIASESPDIIIGKHKVKARIGFPLSIDVATNQLIVTRPDGTTKIVTVLPDQAVQNFMNHKKVNLINIPDDNSGSDSGDLIPDPDATESSVIVTETTQVELIEKDNELVYEIKGKKKIKVLGFIPLNVDTTGYVSAEDGEVVGQEESFLTRLLNLISL